MIIEPGFTFKSKNHNLLLKIKDLEEPNYGRFRYNFDFIVDGNTVKNSIINEYSRLIVDLKDFLFESENGRYFFLPLDTGFIIFDYENSKFLNLPKQSVAPNNQFVGNYFTKKNLVINRQREIIIFDLIDEHAINVSFPVGKYMIINSELMENQKLMISYKDLTDYNTYKKEYSFIDKKLL